VPASCVVVVCVCGSQRTTVPGVRRRQSTCFVLYRQPKQCSCLLASLLAVDGHLDVREVLALGRLEDGDDALAIFLHVLGDQPADGIEVPALRGQLDVLAGCTLLVHEGQVFFIVDVHARVFGADDVGDGDVVGGGLDHLVLGTVEDIDGHELALGVAVLARLGGTHGNDLARVLLDHEERALAGQRALGGVGGVSHDE